MCRPCCSFCSRINQVGYGLCLDKIHLVIEKSAFGKFSGSGRTRAQLQDPLQYALKDIAGAAAGFEAASKLRPEHTPTLLKLSSCYFRMREYERAADTLEAAIALEPNRTQPNLWLGISHLAANNSPAALTAFQRAEQLSPGNPTTARYIKLCQAH